MPQVCIFAQSCDCGDEATCFRKRAGSRYNRDGRTRAPTPCLSKDPTEQYVTEGSARKGHVPSGSPRSPQPHRHRPEAERPLWYDAQPIQVSAALQRRRDPRGPTGPRSPDYHITWIKPLWKLRRAGVQEELARFWLATGLPRRKIPPEAASAIWQHLRAGHLILTPEGMRAVIGIDVVDEVFRDDESFRWISSGILQFATVRPRQLPQTRILPRLQFLWLGMQIARKFQKPHSTVKRMPVTTRRTQPRRR